ncbi:phospholipid carrier-dependent glycosyltransferase [candidate division WWE3 bacterium]|nr:phospholipid carrier-dependent glycosyltransferase [candidate division WWE3 bacterium]
MSLEMVFAILIFVTSLILIVWDKKLSIYILLILSVLLHKELFSIYRWNLLPVRIFMFAFLVWAVYEFTNWLFYNRNFKVLWNYLRKPFIVLLTSMWLIRGVSIIFTKNLFSSVTLFGFFTTMVALGVFLYFQLKDKPEEVLDYLKFYIHVVFALCLFAYLQAFLYLRYEIIIGALWNIPGKFPRLGAIFWDVNHFGGLLAALLPVLGVFILIAKSWKKRIWYSFMFLSMTGVLFLTNSRTSWILGFVAFVVFLGILLFRRFGTKGILAIMAVLMLISSLVFAEYMDKDSPFRKRVKDFFHYRIDSFASHMMLLEGSYEIFEEYPVLGGGYGGFFEHFSKTDVAARYFGRDPAALNTRVPAHTIWGEAIAETGVLGLVSFVLFVGLILTTLLYLALNGASTDSVLISAAMFSAVLGWLVAGTFYSYNSEFFFIVLFLYFIYAVSVLGEDYDVNRILGFFGKLGKLPFLLVGVSSIVLILFSLGKNHLIPWDEAIYAGIAKNMVKSGEYLIQQWHNLDVWYEKPPLYMWLMAGLMRVFGFSSLAARLPSALFGVGIVLSVYAFAKKYFGKVVGFFASLVLLTTVHFLYYSRAAMLDVTTTFFISVSLFLYFSARSRLLSVEGLKGLLKDMGTVSSSDKKLKAQFPFRWIFSGAFVGLAVMTKGVVGFLPLPVMALYELYLLITKQSNLSWKLVSRYAFLFVAACLVFLPWHVYMYFRFGPAFIQNYIGYHVLDRAMTAIEDKGRPFWWYTVVLKVSMRIWFLVLIPALVFAVVRVFRRDNRIVFLSLWAVFVFLFFSAAKSKLIWYIMPLYPALALLIGAFVKQALDFIFSFSLKLDTPLNRFLVYFFIAVGAVFYLFLNKELVYTSDLTEEQARLLMLKDEVYGVDAKVYADRIELPLVLYYTEGPFEIVDFGPLKRTLESAPLNVEIVFITKESRFRAFKEIHPSLRLDMQINEWVLGSLPASR